MRMSGLALFGPGDEVRIYCAALLVHLESMPEKCARYVRVRRHGASAGLAIARSGTQIWPRFDRLERLQTPLLPQQQVRMASE